MQRQHIAQKIGIIYFSVAINTSFRISASSNRCNSLNGLCGNVGIYRLFKDGRNCENSTQRKIATSLRSSQWRDNTKLHIAQKNWAAAMFRTTAQNNIWSNFFVLKPTPKPPTPISRIKGGIFRKAMPENRSLLIVNEDLRASLTPKSPF